MDLPEKAQGVTVLCSFLPVLGGEICLLAHVPSKEGQIEFHVVAGLNLYFFARCQLGLVSPWPCMWPSTAHNQQQGIKLFSNCHVSNHSSVVTSLGRQQGKPLHFQSLLIQFYPGVLFSMIPASQVYNFKVLLPCKVAYS